MLANRLISIALALAIFQLDAVIPFSFDRLDLPLVILPGFGNDMKDYISPNGFPERGLTYILEERGIRSKVVPIERSNWGNIAKGIFLSNFWSGTCSPSELYGFYFDAVDRTVREAAAAYDSRVILVGHSAGGWLARGLLGSGNWAGSNTFASDLVAGLVTLGAPHLPPNDSNTFEDRKSVV